MNFLNDDLFCRPNITLPSVYSDALSFYETVCMIAQRVENVKKLIEEYEQDYKNYTDEQIAELNKQLTEQLNYTIKALQGDYQEFTENVNNNLVLFTNQINHLDNKIDDSLVGVGNKIDLAIQQNNDIIFSDLSKELSNIKVINYFTGELVTIQAMFDYLATFHLDDAITYSELSERNITYDTLVALNIDYTHLVAQGGTLIK